MHTFTTTPRGPGARRATALLGSALLVGTLAWAGSGTLAEAAVSGAPAAAAVDSPPIAADAPYTKTVDWLLSQLTVAEKITLVRSGTDPDNHGQAGYLAGVPRLGIPEIRHVDAMGINTRNDTTAFPTRLGLASSFDREAYTELGEQVGKEGLASDVDLVYGPQVDMARFPSWSRNLTTNGEDAYVSSEFSATEIKGIQSQGLLSQVKHVSMYNGQNQAVPSLVSSQAAHEVYLAPAQSAIEEGGVSSVMCSYATFQIVGEQGKPDYACSNSNLNNQIVKTEFGLKGFITSDYGGSKATSDLLAGMDNEFSTQNFTAAKLTPLVDTTSSSYDPAYAARLDDAVARMVYEYERFGLLDNSKIPAAYQSSVPQHGNVSSTDNSTHIDKQAGIALALKLAEQSGVLLKNDGGALPLSSAKTVAVVGPTSTLMPSSPGGERSRGFGDRNTITPLKAIQTAIGTAKVTSAPGVDWIGTTVPTANLQTTNDGSAVPGLTLTGTDASGTAIAPTVVTTVDGNQTNLAKGGTYTWSGYLNVTAADTYQLLLQRPYGSDSGIPTQFNGGVAPEGRGGGAASSMTLSVDGTARTIANPGSNILPNDFPDGKRASNGQYLGKDNQGISLDLTPGLHQVSFTYKPQLTTAQTPTMRFAWAPLGANTLKSVQAAQTADSTVIFVDDSGAGTAQGGGDNSSTTAALKALSASQANLVNTVADAAHAAGHKVTVVVNSGGAIAMPWASKADAILEMWYPGQEGGTATANLLYGTSDPSGRLPMTFPVDNDSTPFSGQSERSAGSQAPDETTPSIKWTDGVDVGYRWYTDPTANTSGFKPLFAFGHGLSYTTFDYSGLSVKPAADGGLDVTFTVKNTGSRAGGTAPQIYLGKSPDLAAPVLDNHGIVTSGFQQSAQKLVQFDHVELAAGASKTETLHVDVQQLSAWDGPAQKWVVGTGARTVSLAAASDDIKQTVTTTVRTDLAAPAVTTQPQADVTTTVGGVVTLSAAATGTPAPTVRWQRSADGTSWSDVPGAVATSYQFTATAADNGAQYRAVFTNDLGSVTTTATKVHVTRPALSAPSIKKGKIKHQGRSYTLKWSAAAPASSLGGYQVLDGSKVIATVGADQTKATVKLSKGKHKLTVRAVAVDSLVQGGDVTSAPVTVKVGKKK
jgi:beta-glucosidase